MPGHHKLTKKHSQYTTGDIVVVKVGETGIKHHIHQTLPVHFSEFFRNALKGPWVEAQEKVVTLEDVEPATCESIIAVRYYNVENMLTSAARLQSSLTGSTIKISLSIRDDEDEDDYEPLFAVVKELDKPAEELLLIPMKASIFGDRFLAPEFRRAANKAFVTAIHNCNQFTGVGRKAVEFAFKEPILADRVILQCLVHMFCKT